MRSFIKPTATLGPPSWDSANGGRPAVVWKGPWSFAPTTRRPAYGWRCLLLKEGLLEEAEEAFLACDGTTHPTYWLKLGTIALRLGDLDLAEERFSAAAAVGLDSAQLYNNFGLLMARQGRWEEAERNYGLALERRPDMMESLLNMGHGLISQGRWREAEGFFLRALALEPELLDARLAAAAFAFGRGEVGRARELDD